MNSLNELNWFPGHMKKALNQVAEKLKNVDGVIEIGDSRAPFSSFPNYLDKITKDKIKVYAFSHSENADPQKFINQIKKYEEMGIKTFSFDFRQEKECRPLLDYLSSIKTNKDEKYLKNNFPLPDKKFMILGIPNVGKSTLINTLSKKRKAAVENKPGKTRAQQLIRVSEKIYIVDTPGILEPNYEDKEVIAKLAILGSVKFDILPLVALTDHFLNFLREKYPSSLTSFYDIDISGTEESVFLNIAQKRNYLLKGGIYDSIRARKNLIDEFRKGTLGRISLDE